MGTKVYVIHDNKIYSLDYNDEEDIYELHIHSLKQTLPLKWKFYLPS